MTILSRNNRRLATWIFSLLAAAPAASSREEVASLDLLEEVCIQREGGAGVEELLDVVVSAVRVMRRGGVEGRASRKGKRRGPGLPPLEALHACRFEEGVSGGKCKISNGGRTVSVSPAVEFEGGVSARRPAGVTRRPHQPHQPHQFMDDPRPRSYFVLSVERPVVSWQA